MCNPTSSHPSESEQPERVYHPFLLALFPVLSLVADHIALVSFNRTVLRIGSSMASMATLSFLVLQTLLKNVQKAGAIVSSSIILFSTYGYVFDFLSQKNNKVSHRHLLSLWGGIEVVFAGFVVKFRGNLRFLTEFLNVVSGMLVTLSLIQILLNLRFLRGRQKKQIPTDSSDIPPQVLPMRNSTKTAIPPKRDIYYLIIDGHASADTIKEQYGMACYQFSEILQEKGFFVAEQSKSNYAMTMLSLASSLNAHYIHTLAPDLIGTTEKNLRETQILIEDNFVMRFLKQQGYKTVFLGSGFAITQKNRHADLDISCGQIDEATGRFIQSTLLRPLADRMHWIENDKRQRILRMFSELHQLPHMAGPKFVFAHLPAPQWPFLFNQEGNATHFGKLDIESKKKAYLNQLLFIDKKVETWVEQVLANSPIPPIIIIQADHGPNFAFEIDNYAKALPDPEVLREKMRIMNGYFLPGVGKEALHASITPVNTFRLIFNQYFGARLPILKDQSYFSTLEKPYLFSPIESLYLESEAL